jgi:hypothetical protein
MRVRGGLVASLAAALFLTGAGQAKTEIVPLPKIEDGIARLRVVHAINPRLPRLDNQELKTALAVMQQTVATHFNIQIEIESVSERSVRDLLTRIPERAVRARKNVIFDFKTGKGNRSKLIEGYRKTLKLLRLRVGDVVAYTRPHLEKPVREKTYQGLAEALVDTHLKRLGYWKTLTGLGGKSIIDQTSNNEWVIWDLLGFSDLPFELVVSNQPIISAEYEDVGVNSALRGGVSAGTTSYSKSSRFGSYAFISTFPFTEYAALPKGTSDINSRLQAVNLAGQYTAHEIGHMLLLLGHPYRNPACVMRPEPLFNFAKWARRLDAKKCRVGSSRGMKPGAAKIGYRTDW